MVNTYYIKLFLHEDQQAQHHFNVSSPSGCRYNKSYHMEEFLWKNFFNKPRKS